MKDEGGGRVVGCRCERGRYTARRGGVVLAGGEGEGWLEDAELTLCITALLWSQVGILSTRNDCVR